jgi:hypothetical protein
MIKATILVSIIAILLITACKNAPFEAYKQKFKVFKLPVAVKGCYINDSNLLVLTPQQDTPVYKDKILAYCSFATNGKYFAALTVSPGDCYVPILYTYDEQGNKIDEKQIVIGGCGADCGFTCEEYMVINADYSIYISDTISECQCDTLGNEIPGTKQHYVIYKTGRLLSTGKIELSEEMKKVLQ